MGLEGVEFLRYSRQIMLPEVEEKGQLQLKQSTVLIVGMGGLGCPVATYLARAGIGRLMLCDADKVDTTNLQRQILYTHEHQGQLKVEAAKSELARINPYCDIVPITHSFSEAVSKFVGNIDAVADCTDNHKARTAVNRYCKNKELPMVSASAMGWSGRIMEFHFHKHLKPCYNDFLPEDSTEGTDNCSTMGVVGSVLGMMGSMQATALLRLLLNLEADNHGEVNQYNAKMNRWYSYQL